MRKTLATRHSLHNVFALISLALVAATWIVFMPVQLGGSTAYVIVDGNSMEPFMYRGDLVLVKTADHYEVDDVVTYKHPDIGPVIHRIVQLDGDHFVMKGDHNSWLDTFRPTQPQIIGKLWFFVPHLGTTLGQIRSPMVLAVIAGIIGFMLMKTLLLQPEPKLSLQKQNRPAETDPQPESAGAGLLDLLSLFGLLAVGALILGGLAFTKPLSVPATMPLPYEHKGQFTYSSSAPTGVYDTNTAQTGQPLFLNLSNDLNISFDYKLQSDWPQEVTGDYQLSAELADPDGWQRTIQLVPATPFEGSELMVSSVLHLQEVQQIIITFEEQTGIQRKDYTLSIVPHIQLAGTLAGQALDDSFSPPLVFRLDKSQIWLIKDRSADHDITQPIEAKSISAPTMVGATLDLLGFKLPVEPARWIAVVGFIIAAGGLTMTGLSFLKTRMQPRTARRSPAMSYNLEPQESFAWPEPTSPDAEPVTQRVDTASRGLPTYEDRLPAGPRAKGHPAPNQHPWQLMPSIGTLRVVVPVLGAVTIAGLIGELVMVFGITGSLHAQPANAADTSLIAQTSVTTQPGLGQALQTGAQAQANTPMVSLPAGTFTMGSDSYPGDGPGHQVVLDPFTIDQHEVTNAQWAACVSAGVCGKPVVSGPDILGGYGDQAAFQNYPAVYITWDDATRFCTWRGARLPTEAEWELAARWNPTTRVTTLYPWGDTWDPARANTCDATCKPDDPAHIDVSFSDSWPQVAPVGSSPGGNSPSGLFDMAGNVAEWVSDWFGPDYSTNSPLINPQGPASGDLRVVRGGAWNLDPGWARSTARLGLPIDIRNPGVGFRCASSALK
jgi:signal peptidase I